MKAIDPAETAEQKALRLEAELTALAKERDELALEQREKPWYRNRFLQALAVILILLGVLYLVGPPIARRLNASFEPAPAANNEKPPGNSDDGSKDEPTAAEKELAEAMKAMAAQIEELKKPSIPAVPAPTPPVEADPDRAQLAKDQEAELIRLRAEKDNFEENARKKAEELVAAERAKLQKEADEAFPGTARIVTEDLDEKKHKRNTVDKVQGLKTFRVEGELPRFKVATESRDVPVMDEETGKVKVYHEVYPVLATDGRPLVLDTTPELEGTDKVPFQLNTVGSQGAKKTWWVK